MDVLGRLGAVLDLPQGTLLLAELGVTIDLERNSSSSPADVLSVLGSEPEEHAFRAEVNRLEMIPDIAADVAKDLLAELLKEFDHLFGPPIRAKVPPVQVRLKKECIGRPPINIPPRRRANVDSDRIERHIAKEVASGFVGPSRSPWNFQTVLAPKEGDPDGRLCIDFGPLSSRLMDDYRFAIPKSRDHFDRVRGFK
jgi:hypothetical protein